ncbi:MAG TPA: ABC transporter permease [Vicinamibacterales bacterium]|nr:ABC transporter permease [Vicinamibacterales bacterium]
MLNDIKIALRNLTRVPGFALAFILTLGLGIGANTAIFSVINGVLLRPLPYPEADRIMRLRQPQQLAGVEDSNFSFPEVATYREQSKTIDQFVEFGDWTFNVLGRGDPHLANGGLVTANFFQMLGAQPLLGRMLVPEDQQKSAPPVAVLTYDYWQQRFGSDPGVVGQMLDLTVKKAQIVGVLRPGSHYATTQRKQDFYANYTANDHYMGSSMQSEWPHRMTTVYARLAPGETVERAQAELRQIAGALHQQHPEAYQKSRGYDTVVTPWKDELTAKARPTLMILLVTTFCVLIIACANVANLTLTRLVQRERELSVRAALGASLSLLRRQLLAENLVLSIFGGALGLGLAFAGLNLLIKYTARFTARTGEIALDWRVLAFTVVVAVGVALLFAWAPRMQFANDPARAMASGGRTTGSIGRRRSQRLLVVSQLAAAFMLLIAAGLLTRSLLSLYAVNPGFDLQHVLSLQAPNFSNQNPDDPQRERARLQQFNADVIDRVKGEASVKSAAVASAAPLGGSFSQVREFKIDGGDGEAISGGPKIVTRVVSSGYFDTIGTPIKSGRAFRLTDDQKAPPVLILSESMAKYYFKNDNPIGRHITWKQTDFRTAKVTWSNPMEIVGIAADSRADGIDQAPMHTVFLADTQNNAPATILVRTAGTGFSALTPRVLETVRNLDSNRPIDHIETLEEIRDESIAPQRLNATLIGLFALLALVIATVGVAGVLAFQVSQRTNELGIRLALGAERETILRMILGEGAWMAGAGLIAGGLLAIPLSSMLNGLLFGVQPVDLPTIGISAVVLVVVALVAAWIPAKRATAVDPMIALRSE